MFGYGTVVYLNHLVPNKNNFDITVSLCPGDLCSDNHNSFSVIIYIHIVYLFSVKFAIHAAHVEQTCNSL